MMRDIFIQPEPSSSSRPYLPYLSGFVPPRAIHASQHDADVLIHTDLTKTLKSRPKQLLNTRR